MHKTFMAFNSNRRNEETNDDNSSIFLLYVLHERYIYIYSTINEIATTDISIFDDSTIRSDPPRFTHPSSASESISIKAIMPVH